MGSWSMSGRVTWREWSEFCRPRPETTAVVRRITKNLIVDKFHALTRALSGGFLPQHDLHRVHWLSTPRFMPALLVPTTTIQKRIVNTSRCMRHSGSQSRRSFCKLYQLPTMLYGFCYLMRREEQAVSEGGGNIQQFGGNGGNVIITVTEVI